jgi:hypothetical protein
LQQLGTIESPAKISGGGGIGNSLGTDGIEVGFVIAAMFDVFQTG